MRINNWSIDFYVKSKNLYIQFDGNYYHGIGRNIDKVKEFKTETDKMIYQTMITDIKQNKWFKENNKNLLRIKEYDF